VRFYQPYCSPLHTCALLSCWRQQMNKFSNTKIYCQTCSHCLYGCHWRLLPRMEKPWCESDISWNLAQTSQKYYFYLSCGVIVHCKTSFFVTPVILYPQPRSATDGRLFFTGHSYIGTFVNKSCSRKSRNYERKNKQNSNTICNKSVHSKTNQYRKNTKTKTQMNVGKQCMRGWGSHRRMSESCT